MHVRTYVYGWVPRMGMAHEHVHVHVHVMPIM